MTSARRPGTDHPTGRFVGRSLLVRVLGLGMLAVAGLSLAAAWPGLPSPGVVALAGFAAVVARLMPWRFAVLDDGLELWFPLGTRRFLPKHEVTVRVGPGSPVALVGPRRRFGYPLSGGVERRRAELRAILCEHGFDVA